ncbi:glycoside hydrolase family 16 protein [Xylogone sp. PMI_703]|nr:glycoside hydrolase family 16 protein [Xylogone sp. PMI_703]
MSQGGSPPQRPPHITINSGRGEFVPVSTPGLAPEGSRQLYPPQRPGSSDSSRPGSGYGAFNYQTPGWSSENLLRPGTSTGPRPGTAGSPYDSWNSSRRTSLSSENSRDSRYGPFASPFDDSRAPSRTGSEDEYITTQTVAAKFNITPSDGLILFPEDVEKDDYLHNPDPNEKDEKFSIWNRRALVNVGGLAFIVLGVLALFIAYPALTFARKVIDKQPDPCDSDPMCLTSKAPLLKNVRQGLIDPKTPDSALTKKSKDGTEWKLVFSDEFETDGRTFYDGDDPYFQGVDIWYGGTQDLEWYDPDAITTANGTLNIRFDAFQNHNLNYRSGMIQSWNKLCFKGGRMEASISLPGRGDVEGFWPGFWAMGNLGRPGYPATTDGMWPYSYWDKCDYGITPNQSAPDGLSLLPGMKLPACTCEGQDHPSPGRSRSSPEIDALEASVGFMQPPTGKATGTASQSFQAAPFDIWYQPDYNFVEVYDHAITGMNSYRGGPYQQAVSGVTWLNNEWFDGNAYQTYGFEYTPGGDGYVAWFVGDDYTWMLDSRAMKPNGNVGQRVFPEEPLTIIMNFGMSNSFAQVFLPNLAELMPATMRFDYVRIYQDPDNELVTCDPPGYPTTEYIKKHPEPYANQNLTLWKDTNYTWPTNSFMHGCQAETPAST